MNAEVDADEQATPVQGRLHSRVHLGCDSRPSTVRARLGCCYALYRALSAHGTCSPGALRQRRALTDARRFELTAVLAIPCDVAAGSGGGPSMIRRIAGLANRRSRAMLLRFEAVWAHRRPLVWTGCCSPSPFPAALSSRKRVSSSTPQLPRPSTAPSATAPRSGPHSRSQPTPQNGVAQAYVLAASSGRALAWSQLVYGPPTQHWS